MNMKTVSAISWRMVLLAGVFTSTDRDQPGTYRGSGGDLRSRNDPGTDAAWLRDGYRGQQWFHMHGGTGVDVTIKETDLALARLSKSQIFEHIQALVVNKGLPMPEPGAMSYMMSKDGYLNDEVGHWHPHLMFHIPKTDAASWGANLPGSPVQLDMTRRAEPETIFMVPVGNWSDGTSAPAP
jgi:hypothetical protein